MLTINWDLCALCQTDKEEKLINPSQGKFVKSDVQTGYKHTVQNILKLHELGRLTLPIRKQLLDEGPDMVTTFEANEAVWHITCRNKVDNQKIERALKAAHKRERGQELEESPVKTRKMTGQSLGRTQSWFFYVVQVRQLKHCSVPALLLLIKQFVSMQRLCKTECFWLNFQKGTCMR
eukprot:TRINITY_DN123171_c0_g1_i1.p1 TRINITY_DN123171_c0_g1~~TRINITY_DN123171_c0_g1_i1.p1  ORF type:complete len:197 (-),score=22.89 TRINITY_DN123171_c0_g1_i1:406-939(-)